MSVIKVSQLRKFFGDTEALKDVSFELLKGEILGVLGPNGAGKTTLIHCLLGLIHTSAGSIEIFGLSLEKERTEILKRMNFASNYVSLPYSLTPFENLMVYALMYEVPEPRKRCLEVLELFELSHLRNKPTRRLSSGQMMRLCLAKAMINNPEILLLDEPTAGLDPEIAKKTRDILRSLSRERDISVVYTSHNLKEMEELSDRVLFLHKGEVVAVGDARGLMKKYNVESLEDFFFKVIGNEA